MSRVYDESSDSFVDGYWFLIISAVIGKGKQVVFMLFLLVARFQGLRVRPRK
jgi:hypothetical protein